MRICQKNNIPEELFKDGSENNVASPIVSWYSMHREKGCDTDTMARDLIVETITEDRHGSRMLFPPGKA